MKTTSPSARRTTKRGSWKQNAALKDTTNETTTYSNGASTRLRRGSRSRSIINYEESSSDVEDDTRNNNLVTGSEDCTTVTLVSGTPSIRKYRKDLSKERKPIQRRWSAKEDAQLAELVGSDVTRINWTELAENMTDRTAMQCHERYTNNLKPNNRKRGQWTEEEDSNIMKLQEMFGNQWSKIAALIPGRTANDVKNRWNSKNRSLKRWAEYSDAPDAKYRAKALPKGAHPLPIKGHTIVAPPLHPLLAVAGAGADKLSDVDVSVSHELLNLNSTLKKQSSVDDDDDDTCGDYLFEHISSMNKMSKVCGDGRDNTTTKSDAVMSTDIDGLAANVAQTFNSKKTSDGKTKKSNTAGIPRAPQVLYLPPPDIDDLDIDDLANLVVRTARKHEKARLKMAGFITKLAKEKKVVHDTKRRDHNTMLVSGKKLDPVPWNGGTWPMSGISEPGQHDCLIGRGGKTNHHPGNIKWRLIIEEKKDEYKTSTKTGKPIIAMEVVRIWRDLSPPGRFLRKDEETGLWDDIGDEDARIKCSQTLKERKVYKLRLTDDGQSDKGAAQRKILFEQKISAIRQQAVESESDDDTSDSDEDDEEIVAMAKVVVENV